MKFMFNHLTLWSACGVFQEILLPHSLYNSLLYSLKKIVFSSICTVKLTLVLSLAVQIILRRLQFIQYKVFSSLSPAYGSTTYSTLINLYYSLQYKISSSSCTVFKSTTFSTLSFLCCSQLYSHKFSTLSTTYLPPSVLSLSTPYSNN